MYCKKGIYKMYIYILLLKKDIINRNSILNGAIDFTGDDSQNYFIFQPLINRLQIKWYDVKI